MTVDKKKKPPRRRRAALTLSGICTALTTAAAYGEIYVDPRLAAAVAYVDNSDLASANTSGQFVEQAIPGIRLSYDGLRAQVFLDYQLQALRFEGDGSNQVFQQGQFGLQAAALQDWFYFDLGAAREQTVVNPAAQVNTGNLFQVGNTADSVNAHVTPILRHSFSYADLEAKYTYGFVHYTQAGNLQTPGNLSFDNSKNQNELVRLSSNDPLARFSWEARYRHDKVDYDIAEDLDYEQVYGQLGFHLTPSLQLLGRGGRESDPREGVSTGGLTATSWMGGFSWLDAERTELRVLAGRRFFGTAYDGLLRYTGRVLDMNVSYIEEPTTQSQDQVLRSTSTPTTTDLVPTQIVGGNQLIGNGQFARAGTDIYLLKRLTGQIGLRGRLTTIYLSLYSERRSYFTLPLGEDRVHGATITATRKLGPTLTLEGDASIDDETLREGDAFRQYTYAVRLIQQLGLRTRLTLSGNRTQRSGGLNPYSANWVLLQVEMHFGRTAPATGVGLRPTAPNRPTFPTVPQYR